MPIETTPSLWLVWIREADPINSRKKQRNAFILRLRLGVASSAAVALDSHLLVRGARPIWAQGSKSIPF